MATQIEKAERFRSLHEREGAFIIPNPWDRGSARLLEAMGFEALAPTSSGFAQSLGRLDGSVSLDDKARHCRVQPVACEFQYWLEFHSLQCLAKSDGLIRSFNDA